MTGRGENQWKAAGSLARRWRRDSDGAAAVEFALILPVALLIFVGAFETTQAVVTYRKLSDLTTQLASVASQDTVYSKAELDLINGASAQVMAPYSTSPLTIKTTEFLTDPLIAGRATVIGSRGYGTGIPASPHKRGDVLTGLPATLTPSTAYILVQTSYTYSLTVGINFINSIPTMTDQLYFVPRLPGQNLPTNANFANYQTAAFIGQSFVPCTDCD